MTTSYVDVEIPVDDNALIRARISVPDEVSDLLWAWLHRLSRQHLVGECNMYTDAPAPEPSPKPKVVNHGRGI